MRAEQCCGDCCAEEREAECGSSHESTMLIKPARSQGRGVAHFLLFGMTHHFPHRNLRVSLPRPSFDWAGLMMDFLRVICVTIVAACGGHASAGARNAATHTGNAVNIYANTGANELAPEAARALPMVYVPNSRSGSVTVIDPRTYQLVRTFATGKVPQHVVPAYDLDTLWVANNA